MANASGVVGVLRALLTADTAQFDTSMRKSATVATQTTKTIGGLSKEVAKLTPQAERMVKAFSGDRLLTAANNLTAAVTKIGGASKLTEAEQRRVNGTLDAAIAKYRALGQQAPADMLKIANATRQTATASSLLSSSFATLTASFGAAALITGATTALTGFVREAIRGAGELVDLSGKTGLSTETLQRMAFVADQTGASLDDFTTSAFQLGVRVAEGSKATQQAFADLAKSSDALGVSFEQFQRLTPDEQFARVTAALVDVEDQQERNRIGVALMGRTYQNIAAAVAENFNEMAKAATVSTDAQVRAIDDAADAWNAFLKSTTTQVQANLGNIILFAQAVKQAIGEMGVFSSTAAVVGRAQDILALGILKTRTTDIELQKTQAQAHEKTKEELEAQAKAADKLAQQYAKLAGLQAQAFGLDQIQAAQDMVDAIGGLSGVILMDADAQKRLNTLLNEAIDAAQRNGQLVPLEWLRIEEATQANVGTLQDYLKLIGQLPAAMQEIPPPPELIPFKSELDTQRTIDLLTQNAPGSGIWKEAGGKIGTTLGGEITAKLKNAFEDIPHFLTSSVLHSGNFINGLKALGVSMADAIVEPLLKQFAMNIAGARIATAIAGGAGVAGAVSGTASAATAAVSGGAGAAAAGGGGLGASLAAFATNPWTIGIAAAVGGAFLLKRFFGRDEETKVNPLRDQFFAQFQSRFGGDQAGALAKAFSAAHTTADAADNAIRAVFRADKLASFRQAENRVLTMLQIGGLRGFQSFNMGGFVPPGVVQPAILHGPEWVIPQAEMNAMKAPTVPNVNINVHTHISAIDTQGVREFVESPGFLSPLGNAIERNTGFLATRIQRSRTK